MSPFLDQIAGTLCTAKDNSPISIASITFGLVQSDITRTFRHETRRNSAGSCLRQSFC